MGETLVKNSMTTPNGDSREGKFPKNGRFFVIFSAVFCVCCLSKKMAVFIKGRVKKKRINSNSNFLSFSQLSLPTMADDGEDLESICSNHGVPAHIFSGMMTAGWTIATLATGFKDVSDFDDESALQDLGITESVTRLEKAALKVVWTQCSKIVRDSQSSGSIQPRADTTSPPATSSIGSTEGGWHEAFPPKLGHSTVVEMKKKFQKHYPSEILTPDSLPSNRLLALVHQTISKGTWKWIPWKHRMTLSREEDWQLSRSAKYPKIEGLQLHSLLMDEPPTMDVSNFGLHTLRVMFDTFNIAVAMCEGAHLASLKSYSSKFISHLTTRHDAESGLRPPIRRSSNSSQNWWWRNPGRLTRHCMK